MTTTPAPVVLHVGPYAEDPVYTRVVFLDPLGEVGGAIVEGLYVAPIEVPTGAADGSFTRLDRSKVYMNGGRECLLSGDLASIVVKASEDDPGTTVWSAS